MMFNVLYDNDLDKWVGQAGFTGGTYSFPTKKDALKFVRLYEQKYKIEQEIESMKKISKDITTYANDWW